MFYSLSHKEVILCLIFQPSGKQLVKLPASTDEDQIFTEYLIQLNIHSWLCHTVTVLDEHYNRFLIKFISLINF